MKDELTNEGENRPNKIRDVLPEGEQAKSSYLEGDEDTPRFLLRKRDNSVPDPFSPAAPRMGGGGRERLRKFIIIGVIGVVVVILAVFLLPLLFAGAEVSVIPKEERVTVNSDFVADRDSSIPDRLTFQITTLEEKATKKIASAGTVVTERKSSGTIVVYNNYGKAEQKLIKDTRFKTPDGKIYRIKSSIVVPGTKVVNGQTVPGSIEAVVSADKPGAEYNIGLTDFVLPGLEKEPALYKAIYARSKTPMTGGFSGEVKSPKEDELATAVAALEDSLKIQLTQKLSDAAGDKQIIFDKAATFEFSRENEYQPADDTNEYNVDIVGKVSVVAFDRSLFSEFVAKNTLSSYSGGPILLVNPEELNFELLTKSELIPQAQSLSFHLSGPAHFVWGFDEAALKESLAGEKKSSYGEIFARFPTIDKAQVNIFPPWSRSFPDNPEKIKITVSQE